ncbi:MAG: family N-acetyltransferase [Bacteroidota bacterium]|nr:family N-acetyltransferase [Bacteroidota bacterium]
MGIKYADDRVEGIREYKSIMKDTVVITYTTASVEDANALLSLIHQLEHFMSIDSLVNNVKKNIAREDYHLFVMKANDEVIGFGEIHFMQLIHEENRRARLTAFCVDVAYRNKKLGAGFLKYIEDFCFAQNVFFIELTSHTRRVNAHRFYENNGYSISSRLFYKKL